METVLLTCRTTGDVTLVDWATVERVLNIETSDIIAVLETDMAFENADWRVTGSG